MEKARLVFLGSESKRGRRVTSMTDKVNFVRNPSRASPDSFLKANKQLNR